jgi:hypothetical protein
MLISRHYASSRRRLFISASLLTILFTLPSSSALVLPAAECDCHHLEALQLELRNAIKLQQAFTAKIAELRAMSNKESAAIVFANFAQSVSTTVTKPASDTGPKSIDYTSVGEGISPDDRGDVKALGGQDLCAKSDGANLDLRNLDSGAACAGIAQAVRAHEDYHQKDCTRLTYIVYREKHPADRAAEEAAAYGVQIAYLRAEIARVLQKSKVRFEAIGNSRTKVPQNPLYSTITVDTVSKIQANPAVSSSETIKFDGQGDHTLNASVDGNCKITNGVPYTVVAKGGIETDGLDAKLRFTIEGTSPSMGMKCTIGPGSGYGMSVPLTIKPDREATADLPLRNGAELILDQAKSDAAKQLAQGGVTLTGTITYRLFIECPK